MDCASLYVGMTTEMRTVYQITRRGHRCANARSSAMYSPEGPRASDAATIIGVSSSQYQAAQRSCQHLLPTTGSFQQEAQQCLQAGDCPPSLVQQMLNADRNFARCMRSHGVPNWPDPTIGPQGGPVFNLVPVGITHTETHSPPIETKLAECQRLDPATAAMESQ